MNNYELDPSGIPNNQMPSDIVTLYENSIEDQHGTSFNAKDLVLSMEAVEALDFLISGSVDVAKYVML